jgi:pterin-4a-carbinolamine dehydratase
VTSLEKLISNLAKNVNHDTHPLNESRMLQFVDDSQLTPIQPEDESSWERVGDDYKEVLVKNYKFKNFKTLLYFVNEALKFQNRMNHHAAITVDENEITVKLVTKELEQVTEQDLKLAKHFDELYEDTQYFYSVEF